jgi:hypothetical protein
LKEAMNNDPKQEKPVQQKPTWLAVVFVAVLAGLGVAAVDAALYLAGIEDLKGPIPSIVRAIALGVGLGLGLAVVRRRRSAEPDAPADRPRN